MKKLIELSYVTEKPSALITIHHSGKSLYINPKEPFEFDNRQNIGRGSTAIMASARIGFAMGTMSPKIAKEYGVEKVDCHDFVCLLDVKMNFTDLRAEPLWFEKEKINVNGETMIGLKSSGIGNKKRTEKQRQEMEKREVAVQLYPKIKAIMKNKRVLLDHVGRRFINRLEDDLDTTGFGKSVSTFKDKLTSMYNAGVSNYHEVGNEPATQKIIYRYGQQKGEPAKNLNWLCLEDIVPPKVTIY